MPEVVKIQDAVELVPTSQFPHAKWPFDSFNPVQSRLFELIGKDVNVTVAASTAAGKTVCAEMFMSTVIRTKGKKAIYIAPMKSLAKEKETDWTDPNHHFSDLNIFIATGDFRFTESRIAEMDQADVVVMTPEMLASRCRSDTSTKSQFLKDVGCIVFDESHLLSVPSRGDHIEVALMKLVDISPDMQVVMLSATMPNVDEVCGWVSKITNRDTYYLLSEYRPCPLTIHYETYYDGDSNYDDVEDSKASSALSIIEHYPDDKFIAFVHSKRTGNKLLELCQRHGVQAEFHNADKTYAERSSIENRFIRGTDLRVMIATSTVAWGVNSPARRVVIVGDTCGLSPVPTWDINQMAGRAGRPRYDPRGDVYILVPESKKIQSINRLKKQDLIKSTLLDFVGTAEVPHYKTLAFHIVAEINQGNVKTPEGFREWYHRSLAAFQDHAFDDNVIDSTLSLLESYKAIYLNEDKEYQCTSIGKVASMFYFSPFDVADLKRNFFHLFTKHQEHNEVAVSLALANIDSHRFGICNKIEKEACERFRRNVIELSGPYAADYSICKVGAAYHNAMRGKRDTALSTTTAMIMNDLDRTMQVLMSLDSMSAKWNKSKWFKELAIRIRKGVPAHLAGLCELPNIGVARAQKLVDAGIKTLDDVISVDKITLVGLLGKKLADSTIESIGQLKASEGVQ